MKTMITILIILIQISRCFGITNEQLLSQVHDAFIQENYLEAQTTLASYIKSNPKDSYALGLLGHCYYKQGNIKQSQITLIAAMNCGDLSQATLSALIEFYQSQQLTVAQLNTLRLAVVVAPEKIEYLLQLANLCQKQGLFQEAQDAFKQAIALSPQRSDLYLRMGNCYLSQNKFQEAIDTLTMAYQLDKFTPSLAQTIGDLYYNMTQYTMAQFWYQKEIVNESIQLKLAQCAYYLNDLSQAKQIATTLLKSKHNHIAGQAHVLLASLIHQSAPNKSIALYENAIELGVNIESLYVPLAFHYFQLKAYPQAVTYWQKAASIPQSHYEYMIKAYFHLEQNKKAATLLESYIANFGFDEQVRQLVKYTLKS